MKQSNLDNITIALAGMLQAIALIRELIQTGKTSSPAFTASIYSIFQINAKDIASVYTNLDGIKLGLEKIIYTFDPTHAIDRAQHRYLLSLIYLQKKLLHSPKIQTIINERLSQTQKQVDYFSLDHPTVIGNLADIYLTTLSTFKFRILISGNQRVINVPENINKVRALLLAGVRAAVLWRQVGGSRLQLLFSRTKLKNAAQNLLSHIEKDII
jgi:high frequency lysogenization protein